jgi:catechol-2,3-dioxygenase
MSVSSSAPGGALGLWHVALRVRALEPMERFYCDVLGMTVEWRPDPDNVYLTRGRDNLALHVDRDLPEVGAVRSVLDHLGLVVDSYEAVDAWYTHVLATYGKTDTAPKTHRDGARSFYLRDPENNGIQIICHPPIVAADR